jgi:hypothetical protein
MSRTIAALMGKGRREAKAQLEHSTHSLRRQVASDARLYIQRAWANQSPRFSEWRALEVIGGHQPGHLATLT